MPCETRDARLHAASLTFLCGSLALGEGLAWLGAGLLLLMLWRRRRVVQGAVLWRTPHGRLLLGYGVYLGAGMLAWWHGAYGIARASEIARSLPYLLLAMWLLSGTCVPRAVLARAARYGMLTLLLASAFGLLQYGADVRPLEALSRAEFGQASQAWVPGTQRSVVGGFFFHRLKMAHVLVVGICVLLARLLYPTPRSAAPNWPWRRCGELAALLWLALALCFTYARSAYLAVGVAAATLGWLRWQRHLPRQLWLWGLPSVALGLAGAAYLAWHGGRLAAPGWALLQPFLRLHNNELRALIWEQAVEIIDTHPWGIGLGNYPRVIAAYYATQWPHAAPRTYPHHVLLASWAETGLLGISGLLWAWGEFVSLCVQAYKMPAVTPLATQRRCVAAAGLALASAYAVLAMSHDVLYHNAVALTFCSALGFVLAYLSPVQAEKPS